MVKESKGKRFFVQFIWHIFTMESLVWNQMQSSVSLFRFPIFKIFEPFAITALLLGREAVVLALMIWNMGMEQLRIKFLDTGISKIHWFWKGYWAINIVRHVLLWILDDYMPAEIPHCIQHLHWVHHFKDSQSIWVQKYLGHVSLQGQYIVSVVRI